MSPGSVPRQPNAGGVGTGSTLDQVRMSYEGQAILYCDRAFDSLEGKTAHGLLRRSDRYRIVAVVDSSVPCGDAGRRLDGFPRSVPIYHSVPEAVSTLRRLGVEATHVVLALDPTDGALRLDDKEAVLQALSAGLNVVSGLNQFLSDDREILGAANRHKCVVTDIKKIAGSAPFLQFSWVRTQEVRATKVAVLGTDAAVGKRTTAWFLVDRLREFGYSAEFVGTGQTAWLQGARHSIVLDALRNDSVPGAIEDVLWRAWVDAKPQFLVIEGQGSLLSPAYPESQILVAGAPRFVVLQHDPCRETYFPNSQPIPPLPAHIRAIESLGPVRVIAITVNEQGLKPHLVPEVCESIESLVGVPTCAPLSEGVSKVTNALLTALGIHNGAIPLSALISDGDDQTAT